MSTENKTHTTITACRVCSGEQLVPLFSLGNQFVSDFVEPGQECAGPRVPIDLVLCPACSLVQQRHTAPSDLLYRRHYHYRSGTTATMRRALRAVTASVEALVDLKPGDVVLDLGSNDGTLLRSYTVPGIFKVGFEPAENLAREGSKGVDLFINDFWDARRFLCTTLAPAKVITACGMLYDTDDPNAFIADIAKALAPDGVFVAQLMCLRQTLEQGDVGNYCVKPDAMILGDNVRIGDAVVGQQAYGHLGRRSDVRAVMRRHYSGDMVSIKAMYLDPIICTPEHPLLIAKMEYPSAMNHYTKQAGVKYRKGPKNHVAHPPTTVSASHPARDRRSAHTLQWVDAKDVRRGDFVVVPRIKTQWQCATIDLREFNSTSKANRFPLDEIPFNEDFAWLMGLYVAEGCRALDWKKQQALALTLNVKETDLFDRVRKTMAGIGYKVKSYHVRHSKAMSILITCQPIARAFDAWFGRGATNKRIPDFLMETKDDLRTAFLRGLFAGDGYQKKNKIHFHTASKLLAIQVQLMVASLGGMLGMSYVKPYKRVIRGGAVASKDSWQLRGSSPRLAEIFDYAHSGTVVQHGFVGDDYLLMPVKQVATEQYEGEVCNIETGDHTYLVSNAVTHNCHEHLEFYSLQSLYELFNRHNLVIYDVEENNVNGGSYRLYVRPRQHGANRGGEGFIRRSKAASKEIHLDDPATFTAHFRRMVRNRDACVEFIRRAVAAGKSVWVYGASTKGNTILQWYGLDASLITAAADRDPAKWGKVMVGSGIPIMSEEAFRRARPDFALCLPYAFREEMLEREREWRASGGKFIFPIPSFEVV